MTPTSPPSFLVYFHFDHSSSNPKQIFLFALDSHPPFSLFHHFDWNWNFQW